MAAGSSERGSDAARPRRVRKKKRRARKGQGADASPPEEQDTRSDVPAFAARFPRHPDLDRLLQAFEAGNFAYVRREAPRLAKRTDDAKVRAAAQELRRRIDPEPTSMFLWALGVALLLFLYGYYVAR